MKWKLLGIGIAALIVVSAIPAPISAKTWIDSIEIAAFDSNADAKVDSVTVTVLVTNDNWWSGADSIKVDVKLFPPGKTAEPGSSDNIDSDTSTVNLPPMGAPISFILNLTTTATSGIGSYTILIEETNDDDDGSKYDYTTRSVTLYQLDLSASFLLSVDQAEKIVSLGQQISYNFNIANQGAIPDTYSIGVQTAPVGWMASSDKPSVTVNEWGNGTFTVTITAPATYSGGARFMNLEISVQSQATSASQKNVIKSIIGLADLKIVRADLSLSTIDPEVGQSVELQARVYNTGTIAASSVVVRFSIEGVAVGNATIPSIDAGGASELAKLTWTATQGSLTMAVSVDPGTAIAEFDETNNGADLPFVVRASDLTITATDITTSPTKLQAGMATTISAVVRNTGTANATAFKVRLTIGSFTQDQDVASIAKNGATAVVNFTWTAAVGTQTVNVTIDPANIVMEINDNNNMATISVRVNQAPVASINASAVKVQVGKGVTFTAVASSDADGSLAGYYFDFGDGTNSTWSTTNSVTHTYTTTGTYTAKLKVKDNDGAESSEVTMIVTITKKAEPAKSPGFEGIALVAVIGVMAIILGRRKLV